MEDKTTNLEELTNPEKTNTFVDSYRTIVNRPKVISIVQNKGGVGKTRCAMLISKSLAALGFKVMVVDIDFNNNSTAYFLNPEDANLARTRKNIAKAIAAADDDDFNFLNFSFEAGYGHKNIYIVPSSRKLANYRGMTDMLCLKRIVSTLKDIDFVIFDTEPSFTNMVINAENAADLILSPTFLDGDAGDSARFTVDQIEINTPNKIDCWKMIINGYNQKYKDSKYSSQNEYINAFITDLDIAEDKFTPVETWFPWAKSTMSKIKDFHCFLSPEKISSKLTVLPNKKLFDSVMSLTRYIISFFAGKEIDFNEPEFI